MCFVCCLATETLPCQHASCFCWWSSYCKTQEWPVLPRCCSFSVGRRLLQSYVWRWNVQQRHVSWRYRGVWLLWCYTTRNEINLTMITILVIIPTLVHVLSTSECADCRRLSHSVWQYHIDGLDLSNNQVSLAIKDKCLGTWSAHILSPSELLASFAAGCCVWHHCCANWSNCRALSDQNTRMTTDKVKLIQEVLDELIMHIIALCHWTSVIILMIIITRIWSERVLLATWDMHTTLILT